MTTPGIVSSTSPARAIGRSSICRATMTPCVEALAMPTRLSPGSATSDKLRNVFLPVTSTSAETESRMVASAFAAPPTVTTTSLRTTPRKFPSSKATW